MRHLILPAVALSLSAAATIALQLKAALVAEEGSDYLLAARAKGLTRSSLLFKHSFKNAAVPVVTILGFRVATLLGGTVIIETIFVLPGLGLLAQQSAGQPGCAGRAGHLDRHVDLHHGGERVGGRLLRLPQPEAEGMTGIADVFTPEVNLEPEWTEPRAAVPRRGRVLPGWSATRRRVRPRGRGARGGQGGLRAVARALRPERPGSAAPAAGAVGRALARHRRLRSRPVEPADYGSRVSLVAAAELVAIGAGIGTVLGMIAGYRGGRFDSAMGRVVDVMMTLPGFLVAITVLAVLGPGLTNAMIAVGILVTPVFFRVARASTQDVREETYVEASRALGCTTRRIVLRHVFPNAIAPVVVQIAILFGVAITIEASLSFSGWAATTHVHVGLDVVDRQLVHEPGAASDVRPGCGDRDHRARVSRSSATVWPKRWAPTDSRSGRSSCVALLQVDNLTVSFSSKAGWVNGSRAASFSSSRARRSASSAIRFRQDGHRARHPRLDPGPGGPRHRPTPISRVATSSASRKRELSDIRGARVSMIFQQAIRSLDPAFTVGEQIAETVRRHMGVSRKGAWSAQWRCSTG